MPEEPMFVKTPQVRLRFRPWQGEIKSVEPAGSEDVKLTLRNGAEFIVKNHDFLVGQTVQVQPLEGDRYEITGV